MKLYWSLILSSIAGLSTVIGALFIFLPIKKRENFISFCLAFSLSVMISISIFDLIPASLPNIGNGNTLYSILIFTLVFSIGIVSINIVNRIIEKEKGSSNSLYKLGILNFIALILHNFPEGILTFMSTYQDYKLGLTLTIAIAMHNIPEGISIAIPVFYATKDVKKAFKLTLLSGLSEPMGAILAYLIFKNIITDQIISIFLILVAGIMITISIEKMFPEALSYNKKKNLLLGLIVGFVMVLLSILII